MSINWMQAWPSLKVYPLDLQPEQVGGIETIAHALCQKVRFNGHTRYPIYTVGQHCIDGSRLIVPEYALAFLLHELSEVFLPDIPRPLKPFVRVRKSAADPRLFTWEELERDHTRVVLDALRLSELYGLINSSRVRDADLRMLATEQRDLMCAPPESWNLPLEPYPGKVEVRDHTGLVVEFVNRFYELTGRNE